jgi:hydrogenase maturation protease
MMKKTAGNLLILGIGNDILTDDGIGPRLVNDLEGQLHLPGVNFLTAATGGMDILELIRDYRKVIILDAIKTRGGIPGTVYFLTPADFRETLHISSFHDISFLTALELAEKLTIPVPREIHIIAIEVVEDLTFSTEFSPHVASKYDRIREEVMDRIRRLVNDDNAH